MKDSFDADSKQALINYRLDRAYETLREARIMEKESCFNAAVNRLYYACYYAATALLLKKDISAQTHRGVRSMLGLHFTSKGALSPEASRIFSTLFEKRHSSDYDDFVYCDKEIVDDLYSKAEAFIEEVKVLIENTKKEL